MATVQMQSIMTGKYGSEKFAVQIGKYKVDKMTSITVSEHYIDIGVMFKTDGSTFDLMKSPFWKPITIDVDKYVIIDERVCFKKILEMNVDTENIITGVLRYKREE